MVTQKKLEIQTPSFLKCLQTLNQMMKDNFKEDLGETVLLQKVRAAHTAEELLLILMPAAQPEVDIQLHLAIVRCLFNPLT